MSSCKKIEGSVQPTLKVIGNVESPLGGGGGKDGVSPTVEMIEIDGGTRIIITDVNGPKSADIMDGKDGNDGISPTVSVSKSGKVTTVAITDKNETKNATINDGADGERGNSVLRVTTAPSAYTTETGGFTPAYRIALSTVKSQASVDEVRVGDTILRNYYTYKVGYVDASYAYLTTYASIRGSTGTSVTITGITESEVSDGENVVTFSDDKTLTVKNGKDGKTPVKGTDYWTPTDKQEILDELNGTSAIPLNIVGYMEGGNGWSQQNTDRTEARCSGYIEIPKGYKYIKASLDINQYGWAILFSTGNGSGQITDPNISVLGKNQSGIYDYFVEIPSNAKYVFVSSYAYEETDYAYFANEDTEDEPTTDVLDRTEFALFKQWGIVGDSLSVGHTADSDGNASSPNLYYSWGQYLARRIGNTCLNFGRSGVSAKAWMTDDNGYNLLVQPEKLCQCYILALGANDTSMTLGSIADVNFSNMNNNADTEYGWYAKVINAIRTTAPQAPIFLFTLPHPRNTDANIQAINNMIREFAANDNFSMVYLVDLDADYNDYFKEGKLGNCIGNTGWHLTALGYLYASIINEIAISKVMAENYADFQNVFEIPYGEAEETTTTTETWTFELENGSTVTKKVVLG